MDKNFKYKMTDTLNQSRLHGLDFLRAIMMMLGVVLHAAQMYMASGIAVDYYLDSAQSYSMDATLIIINTFRIPTFFLLSGFFTAMLVARRGTMEMIKNRWKRIVLPFLIFLPIMALVMGFLKIVSVNIQQTGQFGLDIGLITNTTRMINNTHNLWFVYYLMMFFVTVIFLLWVQNHLSTSFRNRISKVLGSISMTNWFTLLGFGILIGLLGSAKGGGRVSASLSFVPSALVYCNFGLCFLFGWLLFYRQQDIKKMEGRAWLNMTLAWICLIFAFINYFVLMGDPDGHTMIHLTLSISTGLSVVFFMVSFVGLFSRYYGKYKARLRYLADSAYWVYLFHGSVLVILALLLSAWDVPAELKFLVVSSGTMLICLVTYHYWVRATRIGALLNGRKYPKVWPGKEKNNNI